MDIVFVSEKNCISPAIQKEILSTYKESVFLNYDKTIIDYINRNSPKLVVLYLHSLSSEAERIMIHILLYTKDIPVVVSGLRQDCRAYVGDKFSLVYKFIFTPVVLTEYLRQLKSIWNKINNIAEIESAEESNAAAEKKHILLVDDDIVALRTVNNILNEKYKVSVVKSGAQCLSFIGKEKPDLILLDYEMPVMNGPQTLEAIRSEDDYKNIPVIFLTGISDRELVTIAMKLKPQGYILKSAGKDSLLEKIATVFDMYEK